MQSLNQSNVGFWNLFDLWIKDKGYLHCKWGYSMCKKHVKPSEEQISNLNRLGFNLNMFDSHLFSCFQI